MPSPIRRGDLAVICVCIKIPLLRGARRVGWSYFLYIFIPPRQASLPPIKEGNLNQSKPVDFIATLAPAQGGLKSEAIPTVGREGVARSGRRWTELLS